MIVHGSIVKLLWYLLQVAIKVVPKTRVFGWSKVSSVVISVCTWLEWEGGLII